MPNDHAQDLTFDDSIEKLIANPKTRKRKSDQIRLFVRTRTKLVQRALQVGNTFSTIAAELERTQAFPKHLSRRVLSEMFPEFSMRKLQQSKNDVSSKKATISEQQLDESRTIGDGVNTSNRDTQSSSDTATVKKNGTPRVHAGLRGREDL